MRLLVRVSNHWSSLHPHGEQLPLDCLADLDIIEPTDGLLTTPDMS
jgi:hypothetical protein